jgi:hypothetical protein
MPMLLRQKLFFSSETVILKNRKPEYGRDLKIYIHKSKLHGKRVDINIYMHYEK